MNLALSPSQLEAISSACRQHKVQRMHLFGSALRDDFDPGHSDLDLLVEFQPLDAASLYRTSFALLNELRQSLACPVDLVMADAVRNPYIKKTIDASKKQIYAA